MRRRRTMYLDDARHYYLYVFEPPMTMEEAWLTVDQISGTAVDTFVYGVACGGLFYPTKVGNQFGAVEGTASGPHSNAMYRSPFDGASTWRAWENMKGLMERGLDPLKVLVDRAHEKNMEFIASLRMGTLDPTDPAHMGSQGGRMLAHPEVRDLLFLITEELVSEYEIDGVELDFSSPPASWDIFRREEARESIPLLTELVDRTASMVRSKQNGRLTVGAKVFPTEEMNLDRGLDVRGWLNQGMLDFVVPAVFYYPLDLDPDLPLDWVVEAAHSNDVSVYVPLAPYINAWTGSRDKKFATASMFRAAAANYLDRGADGLLTCFLPWPLGHEQRDLLTELGDHESLRNGDKHYNLRRRDAAADEVGCEHAALPLEIPLGHPGELYEIPFYISDDIDREARRIRRLVLKLVVGELVTADRLTFLLNGESLDGERCLRSPRPGVSPYGAQVLEFDLTEVRPRKGQNVLAVSLDERPPGLNAGITVESVEVIIEYGRYPSALNPPPKE